MTRIDADQENTLVQACEVSAALNVRTSAEYVGESFDRVMAGEVFVRLGKLGPAGWAELRRITAHVRGRIEGAAAKVEEDRMPW